MFSLSDLACPESYHKAQLGSLDTIFSTLRNYRHPLIGKYFSLPYPSVTQ